MGFLGFLYSPIPLRFRMEVSRKEGRSGRAEGAHRRRTMQISHAGSPGKSGGAVAGNATPLTATNPGEGMGGT